MRKLAFAAICGVGLMAAGVAVAEQFNDPAGRLTFNAPSGWRVQPRPNANQTVVLAFNASNDCYFFGVPNPGTANSTANATRNARDPLAASSWVQVAAPINDFFEGQTPTLVSQSVDTSGFWPVQRAELRGPSKTVYAAILNRPGMEIRAFCAGGNSAASYDPIFASLGHPNDPTWQGQATQQQAERDAAAAAAAAQPQPAQAQQQQQQARDPICNDPTIPSRDPRRHRCD